MTGATASSTEYALENQRFGTLQLSVALFCGFAIFHVGGALPLRLFPVLLIWMSESPRLMLAHNRRNAQAPRVYAVLGIDPDAPMFANDYAMRMGQCGANGLSAARYPARIRNTWVGWALGIGRLGGIVGAALGGFLLASGWLPPHILLCSCLTAAIVAPCVLLLQLPAAQVMTEPLLRRT